MTAASTPAVDVEGVEFTYPDGTPALGGVDVSIREGERVAIIGQNGSGKSTLVRQFNGLLRPTTGSIRLRGRPVGRRHVAELAREVAIAFQNPDRQIFASRVEREIEFGPRNLGVSGPELERRVTSALEAVGLEEHRSTNPYDLGFSERKLLALASILAMETPIVVLDEPTTGQDAMGIERVRAIVGSLAAAGRTVIAISHDMGFVAETFDRIIVMRSGRIILDGTPAATFDEANWEVLASTYLAPPLAATLGARAGLGSTPTETLLISALRSRAADPRQQRDDRG